MLYGIREPLVELMITISDMRSSFWRVNTTVWLLMQWKCRAADEIYRFNTIGKTNRFISCDEKRFNVWYISTKLATNNIFVNIRIYTRIRSVLKNHQHHHSDTYRMSMSFTRTFSFRELPHKRQRIHKYLTVSNGWN